MFLEDRAVGNRTYDYRNIYSIIKKKSDFLNGAKVRHDNLQSSTSGHNFGQHYQSSVNPIFTVTCQWAILPSTS